MADSSSSSCSWSTLPSELLEAIFSRLNNSLDTLRSSTVCVSWRLAVSKVYQSQNHLHQIPLLLIFDREDWTRHGTLCNIFNNDTEHIDLPDPQDWWISNSTNGWLLLLGRSFPHKLFLYNPITRNKIFLPSFNDPVDITRCITSTTSLLRQDFIVLVLYACNHGKKLAFCKPGDKAWKFLHDLEVSFVDIIMHKGQFYGTDIRGRIYGCELGTCPKIILLTKPPIQRIGSHRYLIESLSGDFLMIIRKWDWVGEDDQDCETDGIAISFDIYQVDLCTSEWRKIETLGDDQVLFIGPKIRLSVSVSESRSAISGERLPQGNSIFFIHNVYNAYPEDHAGDKYASWYNLDSRGMKRLKTCEGWTTQLDWILLDISS